MLKSGPEDLKGPGTRDKSKQNRPISFLTKFNLYASVRINPWKSRSQENPLYLIQSLVFQLYKSSKFLAVECIQLHWPLMGLCTPGDAMTRKPLAVQAQRTYHSRSTSKSLSMGSQLAILTPLHIILIQTKFFIGDATG